MENMDVVEYSPMFIACHVKIEERYHAKNRNLKRVPVILKAFPR